MFYNNIMQITMEYPYISYYNTFRVLVRLT